jgi:hypothetical protein
MPKAEKSKITSINPEQREGFPIKGYDADFETKPVTFSRARTLRTKLDEESQSFSLKSIIIMALLSLVIASTAYWLVYSFIL